MSTSMATEQLSSGSSSVKLIPRLSHERGGADHGWLKTFHTFSFSDYVDENHMSYGSLRVINEDRFEPTKGLGTHGHREIEIFSYIVSGELEHKDSMGNTGILRRGDIQLTSAGTGMRHSEFNANTKVQVHIIQTWAAPSKSKLPPKYYTRHFSDEEKLDKLVTLVAPIGSSGVSEEKKATGPAPVQSTLSLKAAIISPSAKVEHIFPAPATGATDRKSYIHIIQTSGYNTGKSAGQRVRVNGEIELSEGDGAYAMGQEGDIIEIENIGDGRAEILVYDVE